MSAMARSFASLAAPRRSIATLSAIPRGVAPGARRGEWSSSSPSSGSGDVARALTATAAVAGTGVALASFLGNGASFVSVAEAEAGHFDGKTWIPLVLKERKQVTHNTHFFRFGLNDVDKELQLPVASCLMTRAKIGSEDVVRPYTPCSPSTARGYFDLVVKVYPEGKMSKHMDGMKVGDTLEFKGPITKLPYEKNMKKEIGMIAGGTGITPMLQVVEKILSDPEDKTKVSLIFANVEEKDIILKDQINYYASTGQLKVHYVLDKPPMLWSGGKGYVTPDMIKDYMPAPGPDSMIFVCGPPPMVNIISGGKNPDKSQGELKGHLKALGYTESGVFKF